MDETLEQTADRIVRQEVYACVSALVSTLADAYAETGPGRGGECARLCDQAAELAAPIPDYESAAREAGWKVSDSGTQFTNEKDVDADTGLCAAWGDLTGGNASPDDWANLCDAHNIDPYDRDVFEHWIVSDWLADKLEARGEKVDRDFAGLTVWARTTTGQGIAMDSVLQDIAREVRRA